MARLLGDQLQQPQPDVATPMPPPLAAIFAEWVAAERASTTERAAAPWWAKWATSARAEPVLLVSFLVPTMRAMAFLVPKMGVRAVPVSFAKHDIPPLQRYNDIS
jgi:hypothetical protein